MRVTKAMTLAVATWLSLGLCGADSASGNGGPFVVKYPNGDPAAKGVLARLDPSLRPQRETRLRVVKEDLTISFGSDRFPMRSQMPPLAVVSAAYVIDNPTQEDVQVDFGFPILRGIYTSPWSMRPIPDVSVNVDEARVDVTVISNSVIYGMIRQRGRETIEEAIADDPELTRRVAAVRGLSNPTVAASGRQTATLKQQTKRSASGAKADRDPARKALSAYLTGRLNWSKRDAALLVEYAGLDFGKMKSHPHDRWHHLSVAAGDREANELLSANLGPLSAIGEQKATQFFAQLAGRLDEGSAATYEAIFQAWGGDVRQRAVDIETGRVRPRQLSSRKTAEPDLAAGILSDPTVYARVDYLDPNAKLSDEEKGACRAILKNLPVIFTFAPMNLLHYQASFPAQSQRVITVTYKQYVYIDSGQDGSGNAGTRSPASYQLAYVLHPASLWDDFGPIHLKLHVPRGVACRASVPLRNVGILPSGEGSTTGAPLETYEATLVEKTGKTGELFVGLDQAAWKKLHHADVQKAAAVPGPAGVELPGPTGVELPGPAQIVVPSPVGVELPGPAGTSWTKAAVAAGSVFSPMIILAVVWAGLARLKLKRRRRS